MSLTEILYQGYNTGILALSIMLLAIAIMIYPQLKKQSAPRKRK